MESTALPRIWEIYLISVEMCFFVSLCYKGMSVFFSIYSIRDDSRRRSLHLERGSRGLQLGKRGRKRVLERHR